MRAGRASTWIVVWSNFSWTVVAKSSSSWSRNHPQIVQRYPSDVTTSDLEGSESFFSDDDQEENDYSNDILASSGFDDLLFSSDNQEEERILSALNDIDHGIYSHGEESSEGTGGDFTDSRTDEEFESLDPPLLRKKNNNLEQPVWNSKSGSLQRKSPTSLQSRATTHQNSFSEQDPISELDDPMKFQGTSATVSPPSPLVRVQIPNAYAYQTLHPNLTQEQENKSHSPDRGQTSRYHTPNPTNAEPLRMDQSSTIERRQQPQQGLAYTGQRIQDDRFLNQHHPKSMKRQKFSSPANQQQPVVGQQGVSPYHQHRPNAPDYPQPKIHGRSTGKNKRKPTNLTRKSQTSKPSTTSGSNVALVASPWVQKFLSLHKHEKLMLVPLDFLLDSFNLAQLAPVVEQVAYNLLQRPSDIDEASSSFPLYKKALQLITASEIPPQWTNKQGTDTALEQNSHDDQDPDQDLVETAAVVLYCLVHQRYVLSPRGLEALRRRFLIMSSSRENYEHGEEINPLFGRCPRPSCRGMPLLPAGHDDYMTSAIPSTGSQDVGDAHSFRYCGQCQKYWVHWRDASSSSSGRFIQGCAWGLSLGPLFQLSFAHFLRPCGMAAPSPPMEPRIFGFRLHPAAHDM